jgi:phenylpropionate dioxygenase-like ring-hydroxylating dioxygenase large terminal subunit
LTDAFGFYPLVERYGYAWVWYGDVDEASTELIPNIPTIPDADSPWNMQRNNVFDCSYELYCENLLDLTHADFLHSYLMGDALSDDDEVTVTSTSETVTMVRFAQHRRTPKAQRAFVKSEFQDFRGTTLVHVRSGVSIIHADFEPGPSLRMVIPSTPETADRTRASTTFNFVGVSRLMANLWTLNAHKVTREDNWALRAQNPNYFTRSSQRDLNSRFDRGGLRFRKLHAELVARQRLGDFSYLPDGDPARDVREELGLHRRSAS